MFGSNVVSLTDISLEIVKLDLVGAEILWIGASPTDLFGPTIRPEKFPVSLSDAMRPAVIEVDAAAARC